MKKLTLQEHVLLTENILKTFAQNRITTISEFLQEDIEKLTILSALSLQQVLDIRTQILLKYSAPLVNCATLLAKSLNNRHFLPTHIQSLDTALGGGIPVGCITELCGLAGSGKTQLCFELAINYVKSDCSVLYIDTKGDFSAKRVMKILEMRGCNCEQMATIMSKIYVVHIWTLKEAVKLLKIVKTGITDNLGLLMIDSLASLMFQYLGDDNKIGLTLLNEIVNNVRFISKEMKVAVICVNIQTRWLDHDICDIDEEEKSKLINGDSFIERRNRCMGKYWQHIPSILLVMEKLENEHENKNYVQIQVQIYDCKLPKQFQQCILKLNNKGICAM